MRVPNPSPLDLPMGNWRDIVSSIIFYGGVGVGCVLLVQFGSSNGWYKVDEKFRDMEPKLKRGEYVWLDKRARKPEQFHYGDVIMYRVPIWKQSRSPYEYEFARVVGRPGDVVEMKGYRLYRCERRDGKVGPREKIQEHYVEERYRPKDFSPFVVPRGTLFVLYDDRSNRPSLRDLLVPIRSMKGRVKE